MDDYDLEYSLSRNGTEPDDSGHYRAIVRGGELPDGAAAWVQSIVESPGADLGVRPDDVVLDIPDSGTDETLERALVWLSGEGGCRPHQD